MPSSTEPAIGAVTALPVPAPAPVALAASAGGIEAIACVLGMLTTDFPAPIVVVEHLMPRQKSVLPAILARRTHLAVKEATEGDELEAGTVYVAPPDAHTTVHEGRIALDLGPRVRYVRPSADRLFQSLADEYGNRALVVVLSGTGSDGSAGARAVKQAGGTVFAEEAETATFAGMPAAAIATGTVDSVLRLDEIAGALTAHLAARAA
jgi:two-component system chemotaxis response regulator CheB